MGKTVDKILVIDFETSGLDTEKCQGLSLGAIVLDKHNLSVLDEVYLLCNFDPSKFTWQAGAQPYNGFDPKLSVTHGSAMWYCGLQIYDFIYKHFNGEPVSIAGHNVEFDIKFLRQWLSAAGMDVKFSHRIIDTNSLGMAIWDSNTSNELFERIGVKRPGSHNALEDAKACVEVIRAARKLASNQLGVLSVN